MDKQSVEREYREKLAIWQDELAELKAQAVETGGEMRETLRQRIRELEQTRDAAAEQVGKLRDAGHHAGAELKVGVEMAFRDLQHGLDAAREAVFRRKSG